MIYLQLFLVFLLFLGITGILYSFIGMFTRNKIKRILIAIVIIISCLLTYRLLNQDNVVQMKEDILYVKPKSSKF